jgi:methyl-accepting chemotaxis protein
MSDNSDPDAAQDEAGDAGVETGTAAEPLTITLPDGSESVSDAILAHREMLRAPDQHGLATAEDIEHLTEAMENLSGQVQEATGRAAAAEESAEDLEEVVARQREQIQELQSVVGSLADILGTSTTWRTFDADGGAPEAAGD